MAKICIVLATYNGEKYLSQMLDSLMAQTRPADLIIAVDDGSKDSTPQILDEYRTKLPLQITIAPKNEGHRAAFSKALQLAQAQVTPDDFIALADQDDIWLPQKLQTLESAIKEHDSSLVFGDAQIIDGSGKITHESWRQFSQIQETVSIQQQIAGINNVTGCLSLFRASLLEQILPIPQGVSVHDRWIAILAQKNGANGIVAISERIVQYRIHGENAVGGATTPPMSKTLETQILWAQTLLNHRERLSLTSEETAFAEHLLCLSQKRLHKSILPFEIFWIFKNRRDLFLQGSTMQTLKRVLFTTVGLPLAHKLWGKD